MSHLIFLFWHFPPIFVLLKLTCLVTQFGRKLQIFKNSPKWTIFGIFNLLFSTQNVSIARFARNVEWDFFCYFHTPWADNTYLKVFDGQHEISGFRKWQFYITIHVIVVGQVDFQTIVAHQFCKPTIIPRDLSYRSTRNQRTKEKCQDGKILQNWTSVHDSMDVQLILLLWWLLMLGKLGGNPH